MKIYCSVCGKETTNKLATKCWNCNSPLDSSNNQNYDPIKIGDKVIFTSSASTFKKPDGSKCYLADKPQYRGYIWEVHNILPYSQQYSLRYNNINILTYEKNLEKADGSSSSYTPSTNYSYNFNNNQNINKINFNSYVPQLSSSRNIKKHDFDHYLNEIHYFSLQSSRKYDLPDFELKGGFLRLGSHKVTGQEMNDYTVELNHYLQGLNQVQVDTIDKFELVYDALKALDKDYISGILLAVKDAEQAAFGASEAAMKAQRAQNDADKTIEGLEKAQEDIKKNMTALKQTVEVLVKLNTLVNSIKHIKDIDMMWNDTVKLVDDFEKSQTTLSSISNTVTDLVNANNSILQYISQLNKISHLNEIDTMWQSLNYLNNSINEIQHLNDIDAMWQNLNALNSSSAKVNEKIQALDSKINQPDFSDEFKRINSELDILKNKTAKKSSAALFFSASSLILSIGYIVLNIAGIL